MELHIPAFKRAVLFRNLQVFKKKLAESIYHAGRPAYKIPLLFQGADVFFEHLLVHMASLMFPARGLFPGKGKNRAYVFIARIKLPELIKKCKPFLSSCGIEKNCLLAFRLPVPVPEDGNHGCYAYSPCNKHVFLAGFINKRAKGAFHCKHVSLLKSGDAGGKFPIHELYCKLKVFGARRRCNGIGALCFRGKGKKHELSWCVRYLFPVFRGKLQGNNALRNFAVAFYNICF